MQPNCVLITAPATDFDTFLTASHSALGYSLARASDACSRELSDTERFLSCLAALRCQRAAAGLSQGLLGHVSFSAFLAADDRDILAILSCASGMPFVTADTLARGVTAAVLTGTLAQWRGMVVAGLCPEADPAARQCCMKLRALFMGAGLDVWTDYRTRNAPDQTLYLEFRPNS